jgi:hypothetical protein
VSSNIFGSEIHELNQKSHWHWSPCLLTIAKGWKRNAGVTLCQVGAVRKSVDPTITPKIYNGCGRSVVVSCILLVAHGWTMLCKICKVLATTDTTMCLCALLGQRLPSVTWHRPVWQSGLAIKIRCRQQKQVIRSVVYIYFYHIFWHFIRLKLRHSIWHSIWHTSSYIIIYLIFYFDIPPYLFIFWHSMWRFDLAFYPAFYIWHSFWQLIWHSI